MSSDIIAALIVSIPAVTAAVIAYRSGQGVRRVQTEIRTNGGKKLGGRVEDLGVEVSTLRDQATQATVERRQVASNLEAHALALAAERKKADDALTVKLDQHIADDKTQFETLHEVITGRKEL